jgi:hypothetical protein
MKVAAVDAICWGIWNEKATVESIDSRETFYGLIMHVFFAFFPQSYY